MTDRALSILTGKVIQTGEFDEASWNALKRTYTLGDFATTCCGGPAIPKTSQAGYQFFAHATGICGTAPETVWHETTKGHIFDAFAALGQSPRTERPGWAPAGRWIADVYVETPTRKIAIEIQRSPQTLPEYLRRQERYRSASVECYWLLAEARHITLGQAMFRHLVKTEFGGKLPDPWPGQFCLPELPIAMVTLEPEPRVRGYLLDVTPRDWASAVFEGRFIFQQDRRTWIVDPKSDNPPLLSNNIHN